MSDWDADDYYRRERLARVAEYEAAAENARAARMAALTEALHAVLRADGEVFAPGESDVLDEALRVANRLHAIW